MHATLTATAKRHKVVLPISTHLEVAPLPILFLSVNYVFPPPAHTSFSVSSTSPILRNVQLLCGVFAQRRLRNRQCLELNQTTSLGANQLFFAISLPAI